MRRLLNYQLIFLLLYNPLWAITVYHSDGSITSYADIWGTSSTGLVGAYTNATAGDLIILTHGVTYQAPLTSSTIPLANLPGNNTPVITTTDNLASIPSSGNRIVTGFQTTAPSFLPLIQVAVNSNTPLFNPACGAHDYQFIGVAFGIASGGTTDQTGSLVLGSALNGTVSPTCQYQRFSFDRIWGAGNYNQPGPCRIFIFEGRDSQIINSYLDEAKAFGQDCQAIFTTSTQNLLIQNNWIGGNTENFMCGGAGNTVSGVLCNHISMIGNYWPKHMQWRILFSSVAPATGDHRTACEYYPPDLNYDGIGGGEIWLNNGTGTCTTATSTGTAYECQSDGTWSSSLGSQTYTCSYGNGVVVGGQSGSQKDMIEYKDGADGWIWGNVLANMWNSLQSEMVMYNGPNTGDINATFGTRDILAEYNILRDSIGGFANGSGFGGLPIKIATFDRINTSNNLLDNISDVNRSCSGCTSSSVPAQAHATGSDFGETPTYNTNYNNASNGFPNPLLVKPGTYIIRHNTVVNSANGASGGSILGYSEALGQNAASNCYEPSLTDSLGTVVTDNMFTLGTGGVGGSCGPTIAQMFNQGGGQGCFCQVGGVGQITLHYWNPGSLFSHNIVSEDLTIGGVAFTHSGGSNPIFGTDGPAFNGTGQGTTLPGGTSTCCFVNYLPLNEPTNATPGTQATFSNWVWTYPDYTVSSGATACNPSGTNTTGAPTGTCIGVASDGGTPGADIPTVMGFTANAISGAYNPNLNFLISIPIRQSSSSTKVNFQAPLATSSCTVVVSANENLASPQGSHSIGGNGPTFVDTITGLSGHYFWGSIACPDAISGGATLTRLFNFQL